MFKELLEQRATAWGISDVVNFDGIAYDVEKEIKEADVVLNFSESESFSFTCLEALYYGTPLIASNCGGPSELFEDGKSGCLVPNRDIVAMAKAIIDFASDPRIMREYAKNGRDYIRKKFIFSTFVMKINNVYKNELKTIA